MHTDTGYALEGSHTLTMHHCMEIDPLVTISDSAGDDVVSGSTETLLKTTKLKQ
jgi:hypothetical protein